ncbi:hypothetical protein Tco_0508424 [Tanacetum coccineum]
MGAGHMAAGLIRGRYSQGVQGIAGIGLRLGDWVGRYTCGRHCHAGDCGGPAVVGGACWDGRQFVGWGEQLGVLCAGGRGGARSVVGVCARYEGRGLELGGLVGGVWWVVVG